MKRFLQIASFLYVSFALLVFTQSLATPKTAPESRSNQGCFVEQAGSALQNSQRLSNANKRAQYQVEVWTASWCPACHRYKRVEVPALLKAGYKVKVLDYDTDNPPSSIKSIPTVRLYYKGILLHQQVYWTAKEINKYVDKHLALKG